MRVNARFEGDAEQQLNYLAEATGLGVSEVLRTSVQHYYEQLRAQRGGLTHFATFIGKGRSGRSDVAGSYKARLAEGWAAKHQGHAPAVHEPAPPHAAGATPPKKGDA
ncbi:hypothetical protein [Comamonas flocculans]|uniref:CopG family transcriptional regulator n=1 Tax=Comamonas flocculans TaxID=2597701 RepID=A0A5B8RWX4_9BURK|nr:hypothetical protein [Comamonas flocculans]QEA13573.1 hypothetical protein FOZ74_11315 [Comamonas flocculans]